MYRPALRQSSSGGGGITGTAAIAASSCFSLTIRSTSDGATHDGISIGATGAADGGAIYRGATGIGERWPRKRFHSFPSYRHLPSGEIASCQARPSQNQLASADQPVGVSWTIAKCLPWDRVSERFEDHEKEEDQEPD